MKAVKTTMKAVRLFGIGDLRVVDVPVPKIEEDEVLIRVRAVGVCGSDIPRVMNKGAHNMPLTIGHEFSGRIERVGSRVGEWAPGDRVTAAPLMPCFQCYWCLRGNYHLCDDYVYLGSRCDGALADFVKVRANNLVRLPEAVDFGAGAMTDPAAIALHGIWRGSPGLGDVVAVFGMGPIGFLALQWVRIMGVREVVAVDVFDDKLELAQKLGATMTVNALAEDPVARIHELTSGRGANLVVEAAGLEKTQIQSIQSTCKLGSAILLGISGDKLDLPSSVVEKIMRDEVHVTGSWNSNSEPFPGREWMLSVDYMASGDLQSRPLVSHEYVMDEAPDVFNKIARRDFSFSKVMFNLG